MKKLILFLFVTLTCSNLFAQNDHWFDANEDAILIPSGEERTIIPEQYRALALDFESLKTTLASAPMEFTSATPLIITLPLPNGENASFEVFESPVMAPGLAAKFPNIKSFSATGLNNKLLRARFDYASKGFRAIIATPDGEVFVDPYVEGNNNNYISYYKKDRLPNDAEKEMLSQSGHYDHSPSDNFLWLNSNKVGGANSPFKSPTTSPTDGAPVDLRVYRMALAATGEYSSTQGGTLAAVMSEVVFAAGRLNFVFEKETAVRFELVPNNDEIIFLDSTTDPYNGPDVQNYFAQNTSTLNSIIGIENYDIGHLFAPSGCISGTNNVAGTSGGIGIICGNAKARGVSCTSNPSGAFYVGVLSHEVGHQLGAPHPWSNCTDDLNMSQMSPGAAYSPGSGSTIMSYAGVCGSNNVQFNFDTYLHVNSVETIYNFTRNGAGTCATIIPTNNIEPEVTIPFGDGLKIPISTPFQLTGSATDANAGDTLTYCWEQYDLGPISPLGSPIGSAPAFRTYFPTENPTRIFPRIQTIVSNSNSAVEVLPTYSRKLTFRCTARDSKWGGGGTVWDQIDFDATDAAGPFLVTHPNEFSVQNVGDYIDVTWDVANTDGTLVNCQRVNILLSTNGGFDYPITLATNVPNDGSHTILIPDAVANICRVKVEAADNIFFDISNLNFKIEPPLQAGFAFDAGPFFQKVCLPELPVFEINTLSLLGYDSLVHFEVLGLPTGATADFSANPVQASENTTLTINTANTPDADGTFTLQVMAYVMGGDTIYQDIVYETAATDFSDFALQTPASGDIGLGELPTFTWIEGNAANEYIIEVSDNPSFSTILETATVAGNSYDAGVQLDLGGIYFWRIQPKNECANGDWSPITPFAVKSFSCTNTTSNDGPVTIPSQGLPIIESKINIPVDGMISDLNISNIKGNHDAFKDLRMTLIGPDGTSVQLFNGVICLGSSLDFGMDDEAPAPVGTDCPVNTGISYKPANLLSAFDNTSSLGEWILETEVLNTAGNGGKIDEWSLQICSEANLSPPALITNETMPLPPAFTRAMTEEFLLTEDPNNTNEEITYTIVTLPTNGKLFFINDELFIGDKFTQKSASVGNVFYQHDGSATTSDSFTFTVDDGEGGLIATPQFNIEIDPDIIISTQDLFNQNDIKIFPNPANDLININFTKPIDEEITVRIFNIQGQLIAEKLVADNQDLIQMQTSTFATGIYLVQVRTESQRLTKRVTIQR